MSKVMELIFYSAKRTPKPIRKILGFCWDYALRVYRWKQILSSIRGVALRDKLALLASAAISPITSLRRFGRWQDPVLLWDVTVVVPVIGKFTLRRHTDDLWHALPDREPAVLQCIRRHLYPGAVFVDAGANIGVYTVLASHVVGSNGHVIAIEMMPETASILRGHLSMNGLCNVTVVEQALSDQSGKEVAARVPRGQHGQASIVSGIAEGSMEVRVRTTTLADVLSGIDQVALMKMDLEGAEELALSGAADALKRIEAIIFEDWGSKHLSDLFRARDFRVERLDGSNSLAVSQSSAR